VGDGLDRLTDNSGIDTIAIGQGIDRDHTIVRLDESTARLRFLDAEYNDTSYGIDITLSPDGSIPAETISFADGTAFPMADLIIEAKATYGTNGNDVLIMGRNDDTVYALNGKDFVYAGMGNDTVYGGNDIDVLFGDGGNDRLYGEGAADILYGGNGNDVLEGGAGVDCMIGGRGNDTYIVDNSFDLVVEFADEGVDGVKSSVACTLGSHVENLTLTGSGNINGTGNMLDNVITGNSGINNLKGNNGNDTLVGNTGNDSLTGGNGSDTYIFRRTDGMDTIHETAGISGDTDTVRMTDGISETEPVIVKQNNDLYLFIDSNNYMRVSNQFYQPDYGVERLEVTDGYYITRSDIENIVNTMNAINNDPGMDVIQKYNAMRVDQTYINTLAQSWHQP
jgi:Ca2+-binding RTX toxin-like protein